MELLKQDVFKDQLIELNLYQNNTAWKTISLLNATKSFYNIRLRIPKALVLASFLKSNNKRDNS
jgi:hypothetical protein